MSGTHPGGAVGDLRRMLALLAQERAALLRADFGRLDRMGRRKAALVSRLELAAKSSPPTEALIAQVRESAARNAELYRSAIAGISDARDLIERVRNPPASRVYGRNGARSALDQATGSLERRA